MLGHSMGTLRTSVQTSAQSEEAFSKAREELVYGNSYSTVQIIKNKALNWYNIATF